MKESSKSSESRPLNKNRRERKRNLRRLQRLINYPRKKTQRKKINEIEEKKCILKTWEKKLSSQSPPQL